MNATLTLVLLSLSFAAAIAVVFLAVQIGAAYLYSEKPVVRSPPLKVAVVVPAHNESAIIQSTIDSIRSQMPAGGRLLVVADNCTDDTAFVAAAAGAEVCVRTDTSRIGKGYALDHGVRALAGNPPDVVVFVDADCHICEGSLDALVGLCFARRRPVQAKYSMQLPPSAGPRERISQFAWVVKTFIRPLGSSHLGWPCQLMGTGMAVPWPTLSTVNLATGHLAEDQKLGADLALRGHMPLFCPEAQVISRFPSGTEAKRTQRARWECGHLAMIRDYFLRLLGCAISRRSVALFAFALDLCVPPLSLLAVSLACIECLNLSWLAMTGVISPFCVSSAAILIFVTAIAIAWKYFGAAIVSIADLAAVPAYCTSNFPSLVHFLKDRPIVWVKTERG